MDYEKKYKEALERARKELQACGTLDCDCARQMFRLFPELKESEDEMIRKTLIELVKCNERSGYTLLNNVPTSSMLAWLEKQGGIDNYPLECSANTVMTDSKKKQVKPKFKVGDYIKHNKANLICKIISVNSSSYYVENIETNGGIELFNAEQNFHLWSIQDAKDGDVLASDNSIFIFREEYIAEKPIAYCGLMNGLFIDGENACWTNEKCYPATKKLCDLLFAKMKEAGYEWDAEKKELKIKLKEPDVYECELERIVDKLNEVIGKLGDIHEVLSKHCVFPYRDYTPPSSIPGMDVWYTTHGVEKVPPVTCETTNGFNKSEGNESK